ncbi:flavin monoamine oxidase family protein [Dinghuibacter silviterrae]|uniref:Tryptophan 2-monooxygenase n=1 Tax=Dinghuibacter silviterrae TaxID=1539049 RepID=A0A4R8DHF0_9BACT|nr:FAD-dependent oxidoreductase [Dinghuibacter silviterrae]TDW96380.1 monoamine oxidase [Dinghuibacter silviterrae]
MDTLQLDVAVIGAGCSGAYSAWRLQHQFGNKQRIALFEYSNRIGGRLYTVTLPGLPNVKAEVGGMRYIPSQHKMVAGLVAHLGLETKDFPMGAPKPVGSNCNLFYLRGKHLRLHELADPEKVPYNLSHLERGLGPTNLQVQVMNYLAPNMQNLSLCQQMQLKVFGKELWQYGFWDLMYRVLSGEGYRFMKDAGGYDANVANANAVTQLPATEYSDETQFLTLKDGYDQLPIRLAEQFEQMRGVTEKEERLFLNHALTEIQTSDTNGYKYKLVFRLTETTNGKTTMIPGTTRVAYANKIILGLPRRSLELIKSPLFEDKQFKSNLKSVLIQSAFKLFLAYERPWWRTLGLVAGRSVTDLPVRQVYYFGTESEQKGGKPWLNSLLMASYNDISTVPFWKGLERGEPFTGYRPSCIEDNVKSMVLPLPHQPTEEMVLIAGRQLAEVHAQQEVPPPYAAVYHDWSDDPYGGGWHEWKAGYRLDEIMWQMLKPFEGNDVFVVGEAYSIGQGWVEGALDTAETMLETYFGLDRPSWLDKDYALMPVPQGGCGALGGCIPATAMGATLSSMTPNCLDKIQEG